MPQEAPMNEARIVSVTPLSESKLMLQFSPRGRTVYDVTPYIRGSWLGQLKDAAYFAKVRIISRGEGIAWPEGQDILLHELHELSHTISLL